jgi:AraC family transcriptional regulator, arabinose operon regulatory protein
MNAQFKLSKELLTTSATRILWIDRTWRTIILACKAHGTKPDVHQKLTSPWLGVNLVLRGRGTYTTASGEVHQLTPGVLFQRLPGKTHSTWFDPKSDYTELFMVIDAATTRNLADLGMISSDPVLSVGVDQTIVEEFLQLTALAKTIENELPTSLFLVHALKFLTNLYERARRQRVLGYWERIVGEARMLLERNVSGRIPMESIAEQLGVSYTSFRKHFRRITGVSPGDYRVRNRIEQSKALLLSSSVKQVAASLGYTDPFTFSAQFKVCVGQAPREFQRRHRG